MDSINTGQAKFYTKTKWRRMLEDIYNGINYFADLRMTFRQNFFLKDKFRNKLGVGLG